MNKIKHFFLAFALMAGTALRAQVAINNDGSDPDESSMLDITSNSRGILIPRMTAEERINIWPTEGLLVYQTDEPAGFYFVKDFTWIILTDGMPTWTTDGANISNLNSGSVGIGTDSPGAKLDVRGTTPDDGVLLSVGNSDESHKLTLFGGHEGDPNPFIFRKAGDPLRFSTDENGWTEQMRIEGNGNVGIGKDLPEMRLHVRSDNEAVAILDNAQPLNTGVSTSLYFKTGSGDFPYTAAIKTIGRGTNFARLGLFTYASNNTAGLQERLSITDDGRVGVGTTGPEETAIMDVSSTTKGFLPPRMTNLQRDAIESPVEALMIYNTDVHQWQGYNGTTWINTDGSSCAPAAPAEIYGNSSVDHYATEVYTIDDISAATSYHWTVPSNAVIVSGQGTTSITVSFGAVASEVSVRAESEGCGNSIYTDLAIYVGPLIGDYIYGGVVFWIDGNGGGMVCSVSDQSTGAEWGCMGTNVGDPTKRYIGDGAQNTIDIINECTTPGIAARLCYDYSVTINGTTYNDWFLPSRDELAEMSNHRDAINTTALANGGNSFGTYYWCSIQVNEDFASTRRFTSGNASALSKESLANVRAARAF